MGRASWARTRVTHRLVPTTGDTNLVSITYFKGNHSSFAMLKVDCQICKDPLGGPDRHPVAMPCGHMYCEDCATFWFNSGENKKCFCGKAFKGDQIVRLWTESAEGGSDGAHEEKEKGKEKENLEEECKAELAEGGDGAVVLALQRYGRWRFGVCG
ncbi:hypothetical protein BC629DRAFT_694642 [Irpex lacteus]|nr:hypothetical protein BC629DRAFT_694642 [Irpex lacteus]